MKNKKIKLSLIICAFTISLIFSYWVRAEQAITRVELWDKLTLTLEGPQTTTFWATPPTQGQAYKVNLRQTLLTAMF